MLILTFYEARAGARGTENKDGKMDGPASKANKRLQV